MFTTLRLSLTCFLAMLVCQKPLATDEYSANPENQIVIIEDFISSHSANALMQFYDTQKQELSQNSDNQLTFSPATNPQILALIRAISREIIQVMEQRFSLPHHKYHIDHCALYSRIAGNYCVYHADNVYFDCPVHGNNQSWLRHHCNGSCPGAQFVPNHTFWREYTALLYLNDQFEGGEIVFEDGPCNKLYKKVIPIKPNMLVITPNSPNFYHEVYPIRSGKRYSLHFWYTSDPQHMNDWIFGK